MDSMTCVPAIELNRVSMTKPVLLGNSLTELDIIRDVSFSVPEGEILALIGPSGSGKSTLMRMINRMEDPTSGQILLFGSDISGLDVRELRRRVGMVSQTPALLPGKVSDNIVYGPSLRGEPCNPEEYLELVGLEPELVSRPASSLSVGQQQRMCIARALANRPNILLLDEPTSALDRTAARNIIELICNLNRQLGLTVIIVTHVMEHAQAVATRVAMLVGGVLIEEGAAADFFESPKTQIGHRFLKGELTEDGR